MYIVIETSPNSSVQTEYHIINEIQMKQFIIDKDCDEIISSEDFLSNDFSDSLQNALNESNQDKQFQVMHIWLH